MFKLLHRGQDGGNIFYDKAGELGEKEWDGIRLSDGGVKDNGESGSFESSWAIGHNRYATHGSDDSANFQPFRSGKWFYAHNGNLGTDTDIRRAKQHLHELGVSFTGDSDSQVLGEMFRLAPYEKLEDKVRAAFHNTSGSASFVAVDAVSGGRRAVAARKRGNRPLFKAEYDGGVV
ncbi:MAG: hypothetical protein ABEI52_11670, partial [Halobacteriaceae archaeon]